jgi:uncharacterized protein YidB (DUF937 family)
MAGGLDDILNNAVPGGLSKPLMIALGTLLIGKMVGGAFAGASGPGGATQQGGGASGAGGGQQQAQSGATAAPQSGVDAGSLLGGLGGLLNKLSDAGHDEKVNSWVGSGQNKPIEPHQLGTALGSKTLSDLGQQSGLSQQDLLSQLAQSLPGVIDKLTPGGHVPTMQELTDMLTRGVQPTGR